MNSTILLFLAQDGLTSGAIYALLGFSLVLVFAVTRVIYIPQGDFVAFGALTFAALRAGQVPGTARMMALFGLLAFIVEVWSARRALSGAKLLHDGAFKLGLPLAVLGLLMALPGAERPALLDLLITIAIVGPMGPYLHRIVFQPLAGASVLTLFIAAVALHIALVALALVFFGPEGQRAPALIDYSLTLGALTITGQTLAVYGVAIVLTIALSLFFSFTLWGKALTASAVNALGARLVGIDTNTSAKIAMALATTIAAISGVLIVPVTTIYYDSGFLIGLKGFVAAIFGGLASVPATGIAALGVGLIESGASFFASNYKEIVVFSLVIPVLLVRSLNAHGLHDEEH